MTKLTGAQAELFDDVATTVPRPLVARAKRVIPPAPRAANKPRREFKPGPSPVAPSRAEDPPLWAVHDALMRLDPSGVRFGYTFRDAFDQIYDGQHTGRWDYTQLAKTEKTHIGTIVEIALQREFAFADGDRLDYQIAGVDVDCKWSRNLYEWEIPQEMYNAGEELALLVWANDYTSRWAAGLLRISEDVLLPMGKQRDGKRRLSLRGKDRILWLFSGAELVENTLLQITDPAALARIVNAPTGQQAVSNLFSELQGQLINRATVLTAAQQVDGGKRVRDARKQLAPEGIVIFGHYHPHPTMAAALGLPIPTLGRFVSARLAPWSLGDPEPPVEIGGIPWRLARESDLPTAAPVLPNDNSRGVGSAE